MITRLLDTLAPVVGYETRWPLRRHAVRSGERVCSGPHRKLRGACPSCGAAV